ncbi:MAG TPA: DUF2892 domain-containing protein [Burkholderiales bacterium]
MKRNIGTVDRAIRAALGLALLSLLVLVEGNARWLGLIGLVPLATAALGWCPAYLPFGISTCATKHGA